MEYFWAFLVLSELFVTVHGGSCYANYHLCDGYDWCCLDGYVCTGTSTCLSIGAIVGICIGGIVGVIFVGAFIYSFCIKKKNHPGTVVHPSASTSVVANQQYGQQPPPYGQQQYGLANPSFGQDPAYPPKQ